MKIILAVVVLLIFFSGIGFAADDDFKKTDANNDGKISKQEYIDAIVKSFDVIDRDKNGFLTRSELQSIDKKEAITFMKKQDANRDSKISGQEFTIAAEKRFKFLDKNNDGFIDQKEWDDIKSGIDSKSSKATPVSPLFIITF